MCIRIQTKTVSPVNKLRTGHKVLTSASRLICIIGPHKDRTPRTNKQAHAQEVHIFPNRLGVSHSPVCLSLLRHHSRFTSHRGVEFGSRTHYHTHTVQTHKPTRVDASSHLYNTPQTYIIIHKKGENMDRKRHNTRREKHLLTSMHFLCAHSGTHTKTYNLHQSKQPKEKATHTSFQVDEYAVRCAKWILWYGLTAWNKKWHKLNLTFP